MIDELMLYIINVIYLCTGIFIGFIIYELRSVKRDKEYIFIYADGHMEVNKNMIRRKIK